jgi:hypothetical protein
MSAALRPAGVPASAEISRGDPVPLQSVRERIFD